LRATCNHGHDAFAGSLPAVDGVPASTPADAQARLTRATVLTVIGHYDRARSDCAQLSAAASPLVVAACDAAPASQSGDSDGAYRNLTRALEHAEDAAAVREWAETLAAEIAARRGDADAAEAHFRAALMLDA